jgi:hypothetical protein
MLVRWPVTVVALGLMVGLVSCAGRGGVSISVSPSEATVGAGESIEFSVTVVGARDASVAWTATAGFLEPAGASAVFTAPTVDGVVTVRVLHSDSGTTASAAVTVRVSPIVSDAVTDAAGVAVFAEQGVELLIADATTSHGVPGVSVSLLAFPNHTVVRAVSPNGSHLPTYSVLERNDAGPASSVSVSDLTGSTVIMVPRSTEPPPYWVYLVLPPPMWTSLIADALFCDVAPLGELAEKLDEQASGISMPEVETVWAALPFDLGLMMAEPGMPSTARLGLAGGHGSIGTSTGIETALVALALMAYGYVEYEAAKHNNRIVNEYLEVYEPTQPIRYCTTPTGGVTYVTIHPTDPPEIEREPIRFELTQTPGGITGSASEGRAFVEYVEFENTGTAAVRLLSIAGGVPWISASPSSVASLGPGEAVSVRLTLSADGLSEGLHTVDAATTWVPEGGGSVSTAHLLVGFTVTDCPTCLPHFTWTIGTYNHEDEAPRTLAYLYVGDPAPPSSVTVTITGPADYRRSETVDTTGLRDGCFRVYPWLEPLLPSGEYTAVTRIAGVDYSSPIAYSARVLEEPVVILDDATATAVKVTINRVAGAAGYSVALFEAGDFRGIGIEYVEVAAEASPSQSVTLGGLTLHTSRSYYIEVGASSVLDPWRITSVPRQVDRSFTRTAQFTPR